MAEVIPFPLTSRRPFIERQAAAALRMKPESGEKHLSRTVDQQRDILLRKGVAADRVELECLSLEGALRAAMWSQTFRTGGAA